MLLEAENVSPLLLQILNDFIGLIYSEGDLFFIASATCILPLR